MTVDQTIARALANRPTRQQAWVLLATLDATGGVATLDDLTSITEEFSVYAFDIDAIVPVTDGTSLYFMVSKDGGSTFEGTSYINAVAGTAGVFVSSDGSVSNNANYGVSGLLTFHSPLSTDRRKMFTGFSSFYDSILVGLGAHTIAGLWDGGNNAINAFRFQFSAGNIASGKIRVYGVATGLPI